MFPIPGDTPIVNEAGELIGFDRPAEPDYCDIHGRTFMGVQCPECRIEEDDMGAELDEEFVEEGPPYTGAVDDEDGMSEVRREFAEDMHYPYER